MNGKMGLTQIIKEAWSGIWTGPRQTLTMTPGCTNGAQKKGAQLQSGAPYQGLQGQKYMPLRHAKWRIEKSAKQVGTCIFSLIAKRSLGLLTISR